MALPIRFLSTPRRLFFILIGFGSIFIIYLIRSTYFDQLPKICYVNKDIQTNLLKLADTVNYVLSMQNVTNFLCYGTLWGSLRHEDLLPWKSDFDFCVTNEESVWKDEEYLRRLFQIREIDIDYSTARGVYSAWYSKLGKEMGIVNMYVFEKVPGENHQMRRIGLNRLIAVSSDGGDIFPTRLLTAPLNEGKIRNFKFPVPREGAEIQKYHYKDNWWKELKPEHCS